jgi:hypothetical protein
MKDPNTTQLYKVESSSHWYRVDPSSGVKTYHSVPYAGKRGANGETRSTTLRDARKVGAFPSVTNVLSVLHKEFLVAYKVNQAILASLTLPRIEGESELNFGKRIAQDSKEHAASAARLGSRLHEVGEIGITSILSLEESVRLFSGEMIEGRDLNLSAAPLVKLLNEIQPKNLRTDSEYSEFKVAHKTGFAGTCDGMMWLDTNQEYVSSRLIQAGYEELTKGGKPIIVMMDIKSRGGEAKKAPTYETDILQLAAYLHAIPDTPHLGFQLDTTNTPVANILVSTHHESGKDGRWSADLIIHDREEVEKAWEAFKHTFALWCWVKKYDPSTVKKS